MTIVNMFEAKSNLSRLVHAVESGAESEIVIARNGRPAARLVPLGKTQGTPIGIAKGLFELTDAFDADDDEITKLFYGDDADHDEE